MLSLNLKLHKNTFYNNYAEFEPKTAEKYETILSMKYKNS